MKTDITQQPTLRTPAMPRHQFARFDFEDETLSMEAVQVATVLTKATKRAKKVAKVGEMLSVVFALLLVIVLVSGMGWTMYVTLKCNYCCSGPLIYPPYGPYGPK